MSGVSRRDLLAAAAATPMSGAPRARDLESKSPGLLAGKVAVIYGAAGSIGSAVARAFAHEGAHVELTGRTLSTLETLGAAIERDGGAAHAAQVDALDAASIARHLDDVAARRGRIDISFNLISFNDSQGAELTAMRADPFVNPIATAMRTQFLTATSVAHHMTRRQSGVILMLTAQVARKPYAASGGFGVACAAIEGLSRQLAVELGPAGIRVVTLRSAGSPDAPGVAAAIADHAKAAGVTPAAFEARIAEKTMLRRMPRMSEIADAAVIMASDRASAITAAVTNLTCGEIAD